MGAGRRTQTMLSDPHGHQPNTAVKRGLKKEDLGGVIFVCSNETMEECVSKNLFGLPRTHLCYVLNIEEGLPLFLFNYEGKTLHGGFIAASIGGFNIDPLAWGNGSNTEEEISRFPAQVRVKRDRECAPLAEKTFSRVIRDNYYREGRFMLELTKKQVQDLQGLFPRAKSTAAAAPPAPGASCSTIDSSKPSAWSAVEAPIVNAWKQKPALQSAAPASVATPQALREEPVQDRSSEVQRPMLWSQQVEEEEEKSVLESILDTLQVGKQDQNEESSLLEKIMEKLQVDGAAKQEGGKKIHQIVAAAAGSSQKEKMMAALEMIELSIRLAVDKNTQMWSKAVEEIEQPMVKESVASLMKKSLVMSEAMKMEVVMRVKKIQELASGL